MNEFDFKNLSEGDIVRGQASWQSYQIIRGYQDGSVLGIRLVEMTNPSEWDLIYKADLIFVKNPENK